MRLFHAPLRRVAAASAAANPSQASQPATTPPTPSSSQPEPASRVRHPEAIPCYNYYDIYPEDAGPMGSLVVDSAEDMETWKLVATPVAGNAVPGAEGTGDGLACIQYHTGETEQPVQYYTFCHDADVVYGRAAYLSASLPASPATNEYVVTKDFSKVKHVEVTAIRAPSAGVKAGG